MANSLSKIYYSDSGYWKGSKAIEKLTEKTGLSDTIVKQWLSKQAVWQIYLPAPKRIVRPKFQNRIPNDTHQMDLLFLPHDKVRRKKFRYALAVIDLASRFKDVEPLTNKSSLEVAQALNSIYSRGPLKFPRLIQCDSGNEFKGTVTQLLLRHNVTIRRGIPGLHRSQALVENFNRQLSERLFTYQYSRELFTDATNTEWVVRLPRVLREMNLEVHSITGLRPVDAIKRKQLLQTDTQTKTVQPDFSLLEKKVRYLYEPGEAANDTTKRATDPVWSLSIYEVSRIMSTDPPLYYLRQRPDRRTPQRGFVKEELQVVPPDTVPLKT